MALSSLHVLADEPATGHASDQARKAAADWIYLTNEFIKIGVRRDMGAGIGWISAAGSSMNLLDHYDHGRLVQQSWYGKKDGSLWVDKPWSWNPVQGGDYKGHPAEVLDFKYDQTTLSAKVRPRNWAGGQLLSDVEMAETIRLDGRCAVIDFTFRYSGSEEHPAVHQEVPAAFFRPSLTTLVIPRGETFHRCQPGWPNESHAMPEGWAAWVNEQDEGAGVCSPVAQQLTSYRFGSSPLAKGACSYFAPVIKLAVRPSVTYEYSIAIAVGTPTQMRAEFARIRPQLKSTLPPPSPTPSPK